MKKLLLCLLLAVSFNINAQQFVKKEVTLSLKHHELLIILKKMNTFRSFLIPEKVTEIYLSDILQHIQFEDERYFTQIMPDNEFRLTLKNLPDDVVSDVKYLRFPNKVVYGYDLVTYKDGKITTNNYRAPYVGLYDYTFKPVK
ncbi:hypothetical protein [Flavobacterium cerinum]|uniref:Uncharacterized protein n=1 Tax=Flavobacterium cerinum TaxID=2502784 RepID=A0A444HAQ8_9FLAO|nr:hypothetical protein [Flavobacterium cerinum]RWX00399.1 hypothetical protein EPI11_08970 [Flavobacterium cerinum]